MRAARSTTLPPNSNGGASRSIAARSPDGWTGSASTAASPASDPKHRRRSPDAAPDPDRRAGDGSPGGAAPAPEVDRAHVRGGARDRRQRRPLRDARPRADAAGRPDPGTPDRRHGRVDVSRRRRQPRPRSGGMIHDRPPVTPEDVRNLIYLIAFALIFVAICSVPPEWLQ